VTVKMSAAEKHWYIIHTYSGYEDRVKRNLEQRVKSMNAEDKVYEVVIPTEDEVEIKNGQRRTVKRKIFPGYVLISMVMDDESWNVVRNTPGVTGFVGGGNKPNPLAEGEVGRILKQMEEGVPRVRVGFNKGQSIRINSGPFLDFVGVVDELDQEKGKVRVLLTLFGRETPVELDFLAIDKL